MFIGVLILPRAFKLLRETTSVLLESAPPGLDLDAVRDHILGLPEIVDVHDLHATQIATGLPVLTAHVIVQPDTFENGRLPDLLDKLQDCVATHFDISIEHSTFQFEPPEHSRHEHSAHE
jgi:cobalt-zinc-cadmium efflux system protein